MDETRRAVLTAALEHMRKVRADISGIHPGVAVLHLDAAIAALESQLRRLNQPTAV